MVDRILSILFSPLKSWVSVSDKVNGDITAQQSKTLNI